MNWADKTGVPESVALESLQLNGVLPNGKEYMGAQGVAAGRSEGPTSDSVIPPASPEAELLADFVKHAKDGGTVMEWLRSVKP